MVIPPAAAVGGMRRTLLLGDAEPDGSGAEAEPEPEPETAPDPDAEGPGWF